jgi:hypothetical protein
MNYNINIIKSIRRQLRKSRRVTPGEIVAQNAVRNQTSSKANAQKRHDFTPTTFGLGGAFDGFLFPHPAEARVFPRRQSDRQVRPGGHLVLLDIDGTVLAREVNLGCD